eukprot:CAMPEP_0172520738 /NCGR_PEP_ID=MMETSP1066-20121228/292178_1 /TAXON_ID=671091 /ORGANISM="Coscinodiscus wailesii, Strain CCMP2513" /LENGTH=186 /DNA_ID=CAMNT_0013303545 /DNA_START=569 /DNA_END=1126 /DNA_ORIENTATION=-
MVLTREFYCTPLHATLITHFEDADVWTAVELSNETGVSEDVIKERMGYWVTQRIVTSRPSVVDHINTTAYQLLSAGTDSSFPSATSQDDEEDGDGGGMCGRGAVSVGDQDAEAMSVYESYINGMLANLGQLPLERIHNMLKMFAGTSGSEHKYDKSPQQLSAFLKTLCERDKLEFSVADGMYRLVK